MMALLLFIDAGDSDAIINAAIAAKVDAAVTTKIHTDTVVVKLDEDNKKALDNKENKVLKVKKKDAAAKFDERADSLKKRERKFFCLWARLLRPRNSMWTVETGSRRHRPRWQVHY
jgi:hypothetical protein